MPTNRILPALLLLLATGCSSLKKPNDANFRRAINDQLSKSEFACINLPQGGNFPIAVPVAAFSLNQEIVSKLEALQQAGLVQSADVAEVPAGFYGLGFTPGIAQPVRHFTLTGAGQKLYEATQTIPGRRTQLCYGHSSVSQIVKWTEPATFLGTTVSDVTYTFNVQVAQGWAQRLDVQQAFPEIPALLANAENERLSAGLVLTSQGWQVGE